MAKKKNSSANNPIEAHIHKKDKRTNIPTAELKDFVKEDEAKPKKILYPHDSSLDPQLVWKGKDEQDQKPLEIPAMPIYIQEKIHPQALIEDLRQTSTASKPKQLNLFADFNGIEFEKDIDFYKYEKNWSNRKIPGDSLLVMNSLAEKEGKGELQMITAEIKGLDVYDPTTGQIRSHSTDDIACWFIDTDYNEESFLVRHTYFCGADDPYEKLKKVLRAEINESAWSTLYSTKSRSFSIPSKGKIAVKVINHYGDEVLKGYDVKCLS